MSIHKKRTEFTLEKWPTANSDYMTYGKTIEEWLDESWILDEEYFYWVIDTWIIEEINELKEMVDYFTQKNRIHYFDKDIKIELLEKKSEILEVIENINNF